MTVAKETPLISSTLINWNRKDLLRITLESYLDTIRVPYELFVIDNNSSDGSRKVIESFCKKNSRVKAVFLNKNQGGEAINVGLEMSRALLLHITENDIEYLPGWDSKVIEYFKNFSNLGQLSLFGPVPEDEEVWYPKPSILRYSNSLILYEALENVGTTSIFRRDIWENNIRFGVIKGKEGFSFPDDVNFSKDIKNLGYMVAWADHYLVRNRGHFGEEFEKRLGYYLHNYGSKDWIGREGLKKRLDAWRVKPKPLRKSFLLPKEKVSPEKSNQGKDCHEPQLWSMFDGWSAEMETIELIYALVRQVKPKFVLETGTWHGIAATAIGKALKANGRGKLITIEYDPEISNVARKRIDRYDLSDYVTILTHDSLSYHPKEEIDFLLLDSALEIRDKEFLSFSPKLKPGSLVLFHDTSRNHKVVRDGIAKLVARGLLKCIYFNSPRGLTVCQYIKVSNNIQEENVSSLVNYAENFQKFIPNSELTSSAANLKNANPVCIAGMHRSGTSMVTRMLNLLGLYLGKEEDMMVAAEENPEGFWENNRFLAINDTVLETFGGAWDLIPSFPSNWQLASNLQSVKNNANRMLRDFLDIEHWGWKDPRNSLTLPFWQQFFPNMRVIVCLRHPLEVAYSLQKRNGSSIPFGLNLWYQYNKILLENISCQNRFVIHYDAVLNNVERELDRLTNWLCWTVSDESIKLAKDSVKFHLQHNQESTLDFSIMSSFPYIQSLYKSLCEEAGYSVCKNIVVNEKDFLQVTQEEQIMNGFKLDRQYGVEVNQVEKLIEKNDFDNAKIILNILIKTKPNNIAALNDLAVLKILQKELYQAREILLKALEIDPHNKIATNNLTYLDSLNSPNILFDLKSFESLKDYQKYRESSDFLFNLRERNEEIIKNESVNNIMGFCEVCGKEVKFRVDVGNYKKKEEINWKETFVCEGCGLTSRQRAAIHLFELMKPQKNQMIYLTEQTTLFYKLLKNRFENLIGSEYIDGNIPLGSKNEKGIRNEDLTDLTFSDETFNFVLSFDVFEHIPDYNKALQECYRVLKPGGKLLLSIPFIIFAKQNLIRARVNASGEIIHILEPEYHGDPMKNNDGILCYYHFGWQILDDFKSKGFTNPQVHQIYSRDLGYLSESIVFITAFKL